MPRKYLDAKSTDWCCEPCAEAVRSGFITDGLLSELPDDHVATIGRMTVRPGLMTCGLCGYRGELDVCFEYTLHTIQEFGKGI